MDTIDIRVSKNMQGYSFLVLPSEREFIKSLSPNFRPATILGIEYDMNSDFEIYYDKLESNIYTSLLGIDSPSDLIGKVREIQFIDTKTKTVRHSYKIPS
jgi:hypothetical protein